MHHKRTAAQKTISFPAWAKHADASSMLLQILYCLSIELEIDPKVYQMKKDHALWIFFPYSYFLCDSFWDEYGVCAAFISQQYPISFYGMIGEMESAELQAICSEDQKQILLQKRNISGKDFGQMGELCVKIQVEDLEELEDLYQILQHLTYRSNYLPIRRSIHNQDKFSDFTEVDPNTFYRYLIFECQEQKISFLQSLSVEQQKYLWMLFLNDQVSVMEFEYLVEKLQEKEEISLFQWELALRLALSEKGITISYDNEDFRVTDANGLRLRFDYRTGSAAEKVFLKILFPVVPERN
ncbi:hypothetical protein [Massilioclostridium coli]|uniref:hypothetical protein n=1 Tax=Massilioclostridium coli TaxID=1870991 RepID=UPI00085CAE5E|nr:hypothetical protein [Massilioclostridium coli]